VTAADADAAQRRIFRGGRRSIGGGLFTGATGAALLAAGMVRDPAQALSSYLVAYAYLLALVLGAAAFVLSVHAAGSIWPTAVRRLAEAVMALMPLAALLLIPVALGCRHLYPWAHADRIARADLRRLVLERGAYMTPPVVTARAAACFAFFLAITAPLRRWSLRMDRPGAGGELDALRARARVLSSVALPGLGIVGTMLAWDWLMSLSPDWTSTMFGLYYLAGGFVTALAAVSILAVAARRAGHLPELDGSHLYALGRMLFAFLVFWAYTSYFQYMLSWIADKPVEADWFARRTRGVYAGVALFIVFGHFGLPFLILLSYWIKRRAWAIRATAIWIAAAHYFDVHWIVAGARERPNPFANPFSWMDAAAVLCVGGFALAFATWRQRGLPVAPVYDPTFQRALEYRSR